MGVGSQLAGELGDASYRHKCGKCGTIRVDQQIGGEATPEGFVAKMVEFARGVWRVLRDDGTFWLNLGDSYAAGGNRNGTAASTLKDGRGGCAADRAVNPDSPPLESGLRPGNLVGIPWRVALALQADGWYLRSDLPWIKGNSMPESCESRPSKSTENVFLLTKTDDYYFDMQAIKPPSVTTPHAPGNNKLAADAVARKRNDGDRMAAISPDSGRRMYRVSDLWYSSINKREGVVGLGDELLGFDVSVASFKGAHFATFPQRLIEPMILASTSEFGCCGKCGGPYRRVVEKTGGEMAAPDENGRDRSIKSNRNGITGSMDGVPPTKETVGWTVGCNCKAPVVPCVVLDPFNGSGTTCATAVQHGRHGVGIDLSKVYLRECAIPRILDAINGEKKVVGGKKQVLDMKRGYANAPATKGPIRKS